MFKCVESIFNKEMCTKDSTNREVDSNTFVRKQPEQFIAAKE